MEYQQRVPSKSYQLHTSLGNGIEREFQMYHRNNRSRAAHSLSGLEHYTPAQALPRWHRQK